MNSATYFVTVAAIAIALVTVCAVLIALGQIPWRRDTGDTRSMPISAFHLFLVRGYVELGLLLVQMCLFPLLAFTVFGEVSDSTWALMTRVLFILLVCYFLYYIRNRHRTKPARSWLNPGFVALVPLTLVASAAAAAAGTEAAYILFTGWYLLAYSLDVAATLPWFFEDA